MTKWIDVVVRSSSFLAILTTASTCSCLKIECFFLHVVKLKWFLIIHIKVASSSSITKYSHFIHSIFTVILFDVFAKLDSRILIYWTNSWTKTKRKIGNKKQNNRLTIDTTFYSKYRSSYKKKQLVLCK